MIRNCFTSRNPILRFSFLKRLYKNKLFRKQGLMMTSSVHDIAVKKEMLVDVNIKPINKFVSRTHTCGEIRVENVGENVRLHGWLEFSRANKFIILRDSYGSTQLIVSDNRKDLQDIVENLTFESILDVEGTVTKRPKDQENKKMETGGIEINVKSIKVLNPAKPSIPFIIRKYNKAKEETQLKYRYISLRYPELQKNLRLRSKVIMKMREYLVNDCGFVDIETPTLFKNTPKGAQEFIVPTQMPGQFYSLVQSPQQLKQLLMVGGFDRYFQVAKCYRDETPRHDRQPEFTQIDIEMSFVDSEGVMDLVENLVKHSWPKASSEITIPFKRMKYDDAMELYGTDKPDLRIPQCIHKLTEVIDHSVLEVNLKVKPNENFEIYGLIFSQRQAHLTKSVKDMISQLQHKYYPHVTLVQTSISNKSSKIMEIIDKRVQHKLSLREGDVVFLACGEKVPTQSLLGKVRLEFANMLESKGETIRTTENELLWITDFPLFSLNSKTNALESMHHPFTQPHPDDIQHLTENPLKVKGLHYDLVMNGSEIAGGSIRIHNAKLQKKILKMLNIDESYLTHMIEALESGAPPHGGIAIGLDRLMCLLCNTKNIKNVIAFPKTMTGRDLMANAPSHLSEEEKMLYHIKTVDE